MSESFKNWRRSSRFRPVFFLFLLLGPFVVLPVLVLCPLLVTFHAVWLKRPHLAWRSAAMCTIVLGFLVTQPSSPLFWRLDMPVPPPIQISGVASWLLEMQRPYLNAAIVFLVVAMPLALVSAIDTVLTRRRDASGGG